MGDGDKPTAEGPALVRILRVEGSTVRDLGMFRTDHVTTLPAGDYRFAVPAGSPALVEALSALLAVEWSPGAFGATPRCLWCKGWRRAPQMDEDYYGVAGHKDDCPRQVAIKAILGAAPDA